MKIGVLTSSRADYGIYQPLLRKMKTDSFFELEIIAFGTHLSSNHGYTLTAIKEDGFEKVHSIKSLVEQDDEKGIAISYAQTALKFADFWNENKFDLVLCLGDRFEMSAAVQAGIPFGVKFAHIHGGETTLGAIDNIYRHQISLASCFHFTSIESYSKRVEELIGNHNHIYTVGSISLDELESFQPIDKNSFLEKYAIPKAAYVLVTFHSETYSTNENIQYASVMKIVLVELSKKINIVVTMPNADTLGSVFRNALNELKKEIPEKIVLIENFGKVNYFTAMKYAKYLIGNTSSGIIEAASFGKKVINLGIRQQGRLQNQNIFNVSFNSQLILNVVNEIDKEPAYIGENIYYKPNVVNNICSILKNIS